jgi:hypothetical protein
MLMDASSALTHPRPSDTPSLSRISGEGGGLGVGEGLPGFSTAKYTKG